MIKAKKEQKPQKEVKVYFCPGCKSTKVRYIFGIGNAFGIIPKMRCFDCGLENQIFPQLVIGGETLAKENKKSKQPTNKKKRSKKHGKR
jgi:hypothetical protein